MDFTFSQLKQKEVINLTDGKHLGKVCDISFTFPENDFSGIFVTGCKGFKLSRQEQFVPVRSITKIGEDAVLVKLEAAKPERPPQKPPQGCCPQPSPRECRDDRRSLDEYE